MADFLSRQPGAVWDLIVQEEGVQWQQRFLCASWEATLSQLMLYQEHYKGIEGNAEAYSVDKRQILAAGEDVEDDVLGTCSLDAAGRIIALDMWDGKNEWGECCDDCDACPRICISRMDDVACPVFVRPWDFVRYRGLGGWQNYGVAAPWEALRALESELMVYRVDAQTVQDTSPDAAFWSHWHVLLPEVEVVKADALPPSLRDAAQAFRARLMAQMEQQEERNIRPSFDVPLPSGRGSML